MVARWILPGLAALLWVFPAHAQMAADAEVTIVSSRANQVVFDESGLDYRGGVRFWSKVCTTLGISYRIAGDYELETELSPSKVYVFHMTERLTSAQLESLEKLKERGAAIILVGMTGVFDQKGKRRKGPSPAEKWLELKKVTPYKPKESAYLTPYGVSPFGYGALPGFRFEYDWGGRYYSATSRHGIAANVDWSLVPLEGGKFARNVMVAWRTLGRSRLVWFGVNPDALVAKETDRQTIINSVGNLLLWTLRRPVAAVCFWQGCQRSAAIVTADVEDQFQTGDAIALACHKEGVKGSFFLVGKLAPDYPEVVTALAENGEIGTHSMEHQSFKDVAYESQLAELQEGVEVLKNLGVERVVGFRPPMEEYDMATLRATVTAGLRFIYGNLDFGNAYVQERDVDGSVLYQFARIVADDYNLVVVRGVKNSTQYRNEYLREFRRMHHLGGLFPFSFHTNYLALEESVDVVRAMIAALKKEDVWLTTFGDIVSWMEVRKQVSVSVTREKSTVTLAVTNNGSADIKEFPLHLFPGKDSNRVKLVATPSRGISITRTTGPAALIKVNLGPGQTKEIKLQ